MRRLPVYLLIDTSGSMRGEPIEAVNVGIRSMMSSLYQDPYALETACVSIITFDREVKQIVPLTSLDNLVLPPIETPESGPTHTGAALELLCSRVDAEVKRSTAKQKGDWRPLLFLMTDGHPSDIQKYKAMVPEVKKRGFASIVACAAGPKAKVGPLSELTEHVYTLDTMDSSTFQSFFQWVSITIGVGNLSVGATEEFVLPPPPPEVTTPI